MTRQKQINTKFNKASIKTKF